MLINPKHWPILSRLLDEALEVPPEARERWLESLPAADSAYKEELRTLLRHGSAEATRDFLDILPNLREAVDNARAAVSVTPLRPGTAVGPYVVEREIGSGGMGAVWLARRGDGLIKRPVALKLPHPGPHGLSWRWSMWRAPRSSNIAISNGSMSVTVCVCSNKYCAQSSTHTAIS
jgi:hypothetical protein